MSELPPSPSESVAERLDTVRSGIRSAAEAAGRRSAELTMIVVTKWQPVSLIRELHALGVRDFGENRHQEAQQKSQELTDLDLDWHFVGQLQSKKARQAARYVRVIHSIDRDSLVDALSVDVPAKGEEDSSAPIDAFIQVNLTDDPARGGVPESDLERMAERVEASAGLRLVGVMAVAPLTEEPRNAFARLRGYSDRAASIAPSATAISAGMSGDYREAILEGATHLRIGTAITGNRPDRR